MDSFVVVLTADKVDTFEGLLCEDIVHDAHISEFVSNAHGMKPTRTLVAAEPEKAFAVSAV